MKPASFYLHRYFIVLYFLLITIHASSQKRDSVYFKFSGLSAKTIVLPSPDTSINISVNNIYVKDVRFDTSMIGLLKSSYYTLGNNTSDEISKWFRSSFKFENTGDTGKSIYVYINKCWLSNEMQLLPENDPIRKNGKGLWKPGIMCKVECYYKEQDIFYPLFRLDTMITTNHSIADDATVLILGCLKAITKKIIQLQTDFTINPRKLSLQDISEHYTKIFDIPVLKETQFKKGLYKNFTEFQNNKPFQTEFEITKKKYADMIFTTDSTGTQSPIRDLWGYCDGTTFFIRSADNYFPLTRVGNSFCLKGFKDLERWLTDLFGVPNEISGYVTHTGAPTGWGNENSRIAYKVFYKLYEVDMENGNIY